MDEKIETRSKKVRVARKTTELIAAMYVGNQCGPSSTTGGRECDVRKTTTLDLNLRLSNAGRQRDRR